MPKKEKSRRSTTASKHSQNLASRRKKTYSCCSSCVETCFVDYSEITRFGRFPSRKGSSTPSTPVVSEAQPNGVNPLAAATLCTGGNGGKNTEDAPTKVKKVAKKGEKDPAKPKEAEVAKSSFTSTAETKLKPANVEGKSKTVPKAKPSESVSNPTPTKKLTLDKTQATVTTEKGRKKPLEPAKTPTPVTPVKEKSPEFIEEKTPFGTRRRRSVKQREFPQVPADKKEPKAVETPVPEVKNNEPRKKLTLKTSKVEKPSKPVAEVVSKKVPQTNGEPTPFEQYRRKVLTKKKSSPAYNGRRAAMTNSDSETTSSSEESDVDEENPQNLVKSPSCPSADQAASKFNVKLKKAPKKQQSILEEPAETDKPEETVDSLSAANKFNVRLKKASPKSNTLVETESKPEEDSESGVAGGTTSDKVKNKFAVSLKV